MDVHPTKNASIGIDPYHMSRENFGQMIPPSDLHRGFSGSFSAGDALRPWSSCEKKRGANNCLQPCLPVQSSFYELAALTCLVDGENDWFAMHSL